MLPTPRKPHPQPIIPLVYDGLNPYALAALHQWHLKRNELDKCSVIEGVVAKLGIEDRITISKLNFYKPLNTTATT